MTHNLLLLLFVVLIYFASSPLHFYLLLTMSYNLLDRLISFIIIYIIVYILLFILLFMLSIYVSRKIFIKGHNKISSQESACIFTIIGVLFIKIVLKK